VTDLLSELIGTVCRCKAAKESRRTFCKRCYFRLRKDLQRRLYRRMGDGYEEAYRDATKFLDELNARAPLFHTGGATVETERSGIGGKP
jgi:hypothetical protein